MKATFFVVIIHIEYTLGLLQHILEMANVEEKMDALLSLVQSLRKAQTESQDEVVHTLEQLKNDMARSQKGTSNTGYFSQDMDGEISFLVNLTWTTMKKHMIWNFGCR